MAAAPQREGRIGGVRMLLARGWSSRELVPPQGYITNPKRRAATRAFPEKDGLGFTRGGLRLDRMVLTPFGEDLVADALEGKLVRNTAAITNASFAEFRLVQSALTGNAGRGTPYW